MSTDTNMTNANMDAAKGTYAGFIKLIKRGSIVSAIVTIVIVLIIAS